MPLLTSQVVEEILAIARRSSNGVTTADIHAALADRPDERTLRRWVATVVETGTLVPVASTEGVRYLAEPLTAETPPPPPPPSPTPPTVAPSTLPGVPMPSPFTSAAAPKLVTSEATAGDSFDAFFASSLNFVVAGYMSRPAAFSFLHTVAASRVPDPGTRKAFILRARDRYDHLTEAEADAGGLLPEVYQMWREVYPLGGTPPQPPPAPVAAAILVPDPDPDEDFTPPTPNPQPTLVDEPSEDTDTDAEPDRVPPSPAAAPSTPPPPAPPALPTSRYEAERALGKQATQAIGDALARVAPNLSPELRLVVGAALALFLFGSLSLVGRYPLVMLGLALATIAGIVLFARSRHRASTAPSSAISPPLRPPKRLGVGGPSAPPSVPCPPPSVPNPPSSVLSPPLRPPKRLGVGGPTAVLLLILAVALAIPVGLWAYRSYQRPPKRAINAHLVASLSPLPLRVAGLEATYGKPTAVGCEVTYQARFETTEPLFQPVKWADFVRTLSPAERASLPDASAARALILVTTQTPPGTNAMAYGRLTAWRRDGEWIFTGAAPRLELTQIRGERLPVGDDVYALDSPADVVRLRARLAELLDPSASAPNPDPDADAGAPAERPAPRIRQTKGPASKPPRTAAAAQVPKPAPQPTPAPETASDSPAIAVLRESQIPNFTPPISTARDPDLPESQISNSSPAEVLGRRRVKSQIPSPREPSPQDQRERAAALELVQRTLAETDSILPHRAAPESQISNSSPAEVLGRRRVKSEIPNPLLAATRPGRTYRGTASAVTYAASEALVLEFTEQDADGSVIVAKLSSATNPAWSRPLRGTLVLNRDPVLRPQPSAFRPAPIRLQSVDRNRATAADPRLPLGFNTYGSGLVITLRPEGSDLVGQDARFTYRFHLAE